MSASSLRFEARWSRFVWSVTLVVLVLVVGAESLLVRAAYASSQGQPGQSAAIVGALLSIAIFAGIARFAPWDYLVRPDAIIVGRLGSPLVIAYEAIRDVRRTDSRQIGFVWRVLGSGGFLGWFGLFRSRNLGEFHAYATNRRDLVLITKTNGAKIVISPHLPDTFLKAVQRHMERRA